jgi:hypothetical protein
MMLPERQGKAFPAAGWCHVKSAEKRRIQARSTRAYGALQYASGVRPLPAARLRLRSLVPEGAGLI